jgi:hypothetical protein
MSTAEGGTGGICDRSENSCRVSGTFSGSSNVVVINPTNIAASSGGGGDSSDSAASSSLWALLLLIVILPLIVFLAYKYYTKRKERAHINKAKRAIRQSKIAWTGTTADGKQVPDTVDMWSRPPAMTAMRQNPDPFVFFQGKDNAAPAASDKEQFSARGDPFIQSPPGWLGAAPRGSTQAENSIEGGGKAKSVLPSLKMGGPGPRGMPGARVPPPPRAGKGFAAAASRTTPTRPAPSAPFRADFSCLSARSQSCASPLRRSSARRPVPPSSSGFLPRGLDLAWMLAQF